MYQLPSIQGLRSPMHKVAIKQYSRYFNSDKNLNIRQIRYLKNNRARGSENLESLAKNIIIHFVVMMRLCYKPSRRQNHFGVFGGLYVHVCKMETVLMAYEMVRKNDRCRELMASRFLISKCRAFLGQIQSRANCGSHACVVINPKAGNAEGEIGNSEPCRFRRFVTT